MSDSAEILIFTLSNSPQRIVQLSGAFRQVCSAEQGQIFSLWIKVLILKNLVWGLLTISSSWICPIVRLMFYFDLKILTSVLNFHWSSLTDFFFSYSWYQNVSCWYTWSSCLPITHAILLFTCWIDEHGQGIQIKRFKWYRRLLFATNWGHHTLEKYSNIIFQLSCDKLSFKTQTLEAQIVCSFRKTQFLGNIRPYIKKRCNRTSNNNPRLEPWSL